MLYYPIKPRESCEWQSSDKTDACNVGQRDNDNKVDAVCLNFSVYFLENTS